MSTVSPYFAADILPSEISNSLEDSRKKSAGTATSGNMVLGPTFFSQPCMILAKELLGKLLVRRLPNGVVVKGRIVETEAYPGATDKASHTFKGKTDRNSAMFDEAGTAYVYFIYGMYHCFNISAMEPGAGVLIRALEPVEGIDMIRSTRKNGTRMKLNQLCNGPGRLCQAFDITVPVFNKYYLANGRDLWLENDPNLSVFTTVEACRIGIDSYGEEWAKKPWRYYIFENSFVSKRDKLAEKSVYVSVEERFETSVFPSTTKKNSRKRKRNADI